jgi:hypothetical protein
MNQFQSMAQLINQLINQFLVVIVREECRNEGREPTW